MHWKDLSKDRGYKLRKDFRQNIVAVLILVTVFCSVFGSSPFVVSAHAGEMTAPQNIFTQNISEQTVMLETISEGNSTDSSSDVAVSIENAEIEEIVPTGYTFEGENYRIEVVIESYWENYYNARLMITNTSHEIIHNWGMSFASNDVITNLYNAEGILREDGVYLLKNAGWNQDITPSQTIVIGYMAQYANAPDVAHNFVFPMAENTVENEDYSVYFNVLQSWDAGANVELIIENHTTEVIEDWALEFTFDHTITNIWNAEVINQEGNSYQLHASDYAANILPSGSATVGMVISYAEAGYDVNTLCVDEVTLREIILAEGDSSIDDSEGNVSDNTTFDNTDSNNTISDNTASDNDIPDIMEGVVCLESSFEGGYEGQIYYKEILSEEDIVTTPEGLPYVQNQLILMAKDTATFETVQSQVTAIGAEIVGYIEATNHYQIEFVHDTAPESLGAWIEQLENQDWVQSAYYNFLWVEEPEFSTTDPWHPDETNLEWNSSHPAGSNWGIEEINLRDALTHAGVIERISSSANDITTEHLTTVRIGILDNAFDEWHEDLDDNFLAVWNNFDNFKELEEEYVENTRLDHGTHVAGIIGAEFNNGLGIAGICVKNELLAYSFDGWRKPALPEDCTFSTHTFQIISGLNALICNGVRVINYSYGNDAISFAASQTGDDEEDRIRRRGAIDYLTNNASIVGEFLDSCLAGGYDFVIVSAAGNTNTKRFYQRSTLGNSPWGYINAYNYDNMEEDERPEDVDASVSYGSASSTAGINTMNYVEAVYNSVFNYIPDTYACYDNIICVGGLARPTYDSHNQPLYQATSMTCSGNRVDIFAPGQYIYSCTITDVSSNNCISKNGTSMAAPFVSGAIGLAYNVYPEISGAELKQLIIATATNRGPGLNVLNVADFIEAVIQIKEQREMCQVQLQVTDVSGNAVAGAKIEIRSRGIYYFMALGGMNAWEAVENNLFYSSYELQTDVSGNIICYLPEGHYYAVVTEGDNEGETYHIWVQDTDIGNTQSHTIALKEYNNQVTQYLRFQVRYADGRGDVNDAHVILYEGWNQSGGNVVAETTITNPNRYTMGRVTFQVPEGYYTALVSDGAGNQAYSNLIVNSTIISYIVYL